MIKFRMAAKTDIGLVRKNNEDNFQAAADLSSGQMRWVNNEICSLGEKGALLVVADGMGGMNAGEVASALAIETVRENFSLENLTSEVTKNRFSIEKFMNETIVAADERIKAEAREHPESRGMGTTIVIGWVYKDKLYVSWCGDSRAYIYNPKAGLHQITKDHSYVQSLVDKGTITREDAFDFPDSNIITRSLSDASTKAKPESLMQPYDLCNEDIILLCTDGLCGMIRNEEIEAVIRTNDGNLDTLSDELIRAACDAEGSDNITICLFKVLSGGSTCNPDLFKETEKWLDGKSKNIIDTVINKNNKLRHSSKIFIVLACIIVICCVVIAAPKLIQLVGHDGNYETPIDSSSIIEENSIEQNNEPTESTNPIEDSAGNIMRKGYNPIGNNNELHVVNEEDSNLNEIEDDANPDDYPLEEVDGLTQISDNDSNNNEEEQDDDESYPTKDSKEYTEIYIIKKGDNLGSIAKAYKIKVEELMKMNALSSDTIKAGDTIKVPKRFR